jgi:[protein-PII] uridylyltransferase
VASYLHRARAVIRRMFAGSGPESSPGGAGPAAPAVAIDDYLAAEGDRIGFLNPERAAADPRAWLRLLEGALDRDRAFAPSACDLLRAQTSHLSSNAMLWGSYECQRFISLLRPRPGLAARLSDLRTCGVLTALFPEFLTDDDDHTLRAISRLERLLSDTDLIGGRFGSMLRELDRPELVVLALLLHYSAISHEHAPVSAADLALPVLERLQVEGDARQAVDFLIERQLLLTQTAFRQDIADPKVIARLAGEVMTAAQLNSITAEEHLKMLCVQTIAELGAGGREPLTSWRAELLWRLYVDTYNQLTMAYGDTVIDADAVARSALQRNRPEDIAEAELLAFLQGLPQRYLTLFDEHTIYQHVRLSRQISADQVHTFLVRNEVSWGLTVVTLDKPYLFANICGVLASVGADILRGQALTSRSGLVLDVFEFVDRENTIDKTQLTQLLDDVIAGRVDIGTRLAAARVTGEPTQPALPVVYFDNDSSERYTVLEVVADDMAGLLHRISGALSEFGCEVDLVLIATEGDQATDVFHIRKGGEKLSDSDQLLLTGMLERAILG